MVSSGKLVPLELLCFLLAHGVGMPTAGPGGLEAEFGETSVDVLEPGPFVPAKLKGADLVGQAVDILTADPIGYLNSAGNIFDFDYRATTEANGEYVSYPSGMTLAPVSNCGREISTFTTNSITDYRRHVTNEVEAGARFKMLTGSYADSTEEVLSYLSSHDAFVSRSHTYCVTYRLQLHPGYASFNPIFADTVRSLPTHFDNKTKPAFFDFFRDWKTHITTKCKVGGAMSRFAFTGSYYSPNEETIKMHARLSFLAKISSSTSSSTSADMKSFERHTTFTEVATYGGNQPQNDEWAGWKKTVLKLENPQCLDWGVISMSDVLTPEWTSDRELNARSQAVSQALDAYFKRPGCTDPLYRNYDHTALQDDNSCGPRLVKSLEVSAYIDGIDELSIGNGNILRWQHIGYVDVGIQNGHHDPVYLTYTFEDGSRLEKRWWAMKTKTYESEVALNFCGSPTFRKIDGRSQMEVKERAVESNEWTTTIHFVDQPDGAAWYRFELIWDHSALCPHKESSKPKYSNLLSTQMVQTTSGEWPNAKSSIFCGWAVFALLAALIVGSLLTKKRNQRDGYESVPVTEDNGVLLSEDAL